MNRAVFILSEQQLDAITRHFTERSGREAAGYIFCGSSRINADPWTGYEQEKFVARHFDPVSESAVISSSALHITWNTGHFIQALRRCRDETETIALIHYHPGGLDCFSDQDDRNEAALAAIVQKRNGRPLRFVSLMLLPDGRIFGRIWTNPNEFQLLDLICVVGRRYTLHYPGRGAGQPLDFLHRQALALGEAMNQDLSQLRVGIVGCGATGSATSLLLPRLGIRRVALFDKDPADKTNLNRLHFSRMRDVAEGRLKVDLIKRGIDDMELGVDVRVFRGWVNDHNFRDALKSCDIIFGCTDDNAGRLFLNRYAYFYSTPVIDMGLAIHVGDGNPPQVQAFDGRVTVLQPGTTCLLCRGVINVQRAFAESLKRVDPAEYVRRKAEAYVIGEGNPSPAVVPFTTSVATMAVEELIHRLQGFRGPNGAADQRLRQFHRGVDRHPGHMPQNDCPICGSSEYWGRGDMEPFLDATL